jgi:hypothetical protein
VRLEYPWTTRSLSALGQTDRQSGRLLLARKRSSSSQRRRCPPRPAPALGFQHAVATVANRVALWRSRAFRLNSPIAGPSALIERLRRLLMEPESEKGPPHCRARAETPGTINQKRDRGAVRVVLARRENRCVNRMPRSDSRHQHGRALSVGSVDELADHCSRAN